MKPEYRKGAEARKNFEETMRKLFRAPKSAVTKKPPKQDEPLSQESSPSNETNSKSR